jgi:polyvinyl alcohol dehydrogenase (cytochrome)
MSLSCQVDLATGRLVWKTYVTPPNFSGAAVWGSTPSIDPSLGLVYIATGTLLVMPLCVIGSDWYVYTTYFVY